MSEITVTVVGSTTQPALVTGGEVVNVTFADQGGGSGNPAAATIEVGTVETVDSTAAAAVVNAGTAYAARLDFKIPRSQPNSLSIGSVSSGTAAAAVITGAAPSQTLSLVLPAGQANSLSIGSVTSGPTASATITGAAPSQTLSLVLPQGATGQTGAQGPQGDAGPPNSLSIGTVTKGDNPSATITGTAPSQTISLVLPKGDKGDTGEPGPYTSIQVGSTTTGAPGTQASVATVSNGSTVTLNFTIPRGVDGTANLGDETPQPLGTASAGTSGYAARADHVHAVPTISYTSLTNKPSTFPPSAHSHAVSDVIGLTAALDGKQAAGSYATLDGSGKVPSSQLPSYVDDVSEYANLAGFPATGETGKIFVARDTNKTYRWSGSAYIEISASPGTTDAVPEGSTNLYFTTGRASAAAPVQSVAGRTGTITLTSSDVGLENVPNVDATSRANHTGTQAISTVDGLQTALDGKQAAGNYLTSAVTSLNNLTGSLTLAAGNNVTITPSGSTLTIDATASGGIGANDAVDGGDYVGESVTTITITSQPSNQTATVINDAFAATFTAAATVSPSGTPLFQWQKSDDSGFSWSSINGATSSGLTLSGLTQSSDNGDKYRVVVSASGASSVTSSSATLTVPDATLSITSHPSNQTALSGSAAFSVSAVVSPTAALSYQWQRSDDGGVTWSNVSNATSSTLSLTGLTYASDNADKYRVIVSSPGSQSATSTAATLTVEPSTLAFRWGGSALTPQQVDSSLWTSVVAAEGTGISFAGIKSDGTLWACGEAIGDGSSYGTFVPVELSGAQWISVAAQNNYLVAVKANGTLWILGTRYGGVFTTLTQVGTSNQWVSIFANNRGMKSDGSIWAISESLVESQVSQGPYKFASAFTGDMLAIKQDNTLWRLSSYYGTVAQVGTDTWATASAGYDSFYAIKPDGTLWAWGSNFWGSLGDGTTVERVDPVQIGSDQDWASVSAGLQNAHAIKTNGTLWGWGKNAAGEVGDGTQWPGVGPGVTSPVQIGWRQWQSVSSGWYRTAAIRLAPSRALAISSQPVDGNPGSGSSASFSVTASSTPSATLSYQWRWSSNGGSTWTNIGPGITSYWDSASGYNSSSLTLSGINKSSLATLQNSSQWIRISVLVLTVGADPLASNTVKLLPGVV